VGLNSAKRQPADWMEYMIGMYTFRAFAEGKPSWMLSYSWDGEDKIRPADAIENLAMSQVMAGTNSWDAHRFVMGGSNDLEARTRVYKWISENEKLIYAPRKTIAPVGIYFSPKTRSYFATDWTPTYLGIMNLLLMEHIEFEIVTPRTLRTSNCKILILPDVKCLSDIEYTQLELRLKNGSTLISTGETAKYDDKREISKNPLRMQQLSNIYPGIKCIDGNTAAFYNYLKENSNQTAYKSEYTVNENNGISQLLDQIHQAKAYSPSVKIENADGCVTQIASVDEKSTIFLANFSGIKGNENANQSPKKDIVITFAVAKSDSKVIIIPFLGQPQNLMGKWKSGKLVVTLPEILRGAIIQLQ